MKRAFCMLALVACVVSPVASGQAQSANSYVGVKSCAGVCHKTEKSGNQLGLWEQSKHSHAAEALMTPKADEIARSKGLAKPAAESPECLGCHANVAAPADPKQGVQCETCHGPGSGYKSLSVMKDRAKAIAAGMTEYKDNAAIEKQCRTCHNEKSPTMKEFNFAEVWPKIAHPAPKAP